MKDPRFKQAVDHYRHGRKAAAQALLLQLVEEDEHNEQVWLLLSATVDPLAEQIIALQNVLYLNPDNHKARQRLIKLLTREGIAAVKQENHKEGQDYLRESLKLNNKNAAAWLWLSRTNLDLDERIFALKQVLHLKPDYQPAAEELDELLTIGSDLFQQAEYYTKKREYTLAAAAYQKIIMHNHGPKRTLARQKLKELQQREQEEAIAPPPPDGRTLARLTVGPPLFYNMMLFLHAGLNPLRVAPILFMAGGVVLFGTFLMVGTHFTPEHPLWRSIFGRRGLTKHTRTAIWLTGLICTALPFILLLTAAYRQYQLTAGDLPWAQ